MNEKKEISPKTVAPRDGYDNTGTQGKDSLSDDAFTGSSKKPSANAGEDEESGTGSKGEDFHDAEEE